MLVVPTRVQGDGAAAEIAAAIATANRLPLAIDCLVVTRGGGSLEDLWAFNEEAVVRAIYRLADPGDFRHRPRDRRDLVRPGGRRPRPDAQRGGRVGGAGGRGVARPAAADSRSGSPRPCVGGWRRAGRGSMRLPGIASFAGPLQRIEDLARRLDELEDRGRAPCAAAGAAARQLEQPAARLESLSPLAVLGRGYSLTQRAADGRLIRDAAELAAGEQITTRFSHGETISRVEEIRP